jgi:hypothetical protein
VLAKFNVFKRHLLFLALPLKNWVMDSIYHFPKVLSPPDIPNQRRKYLFSISSDCDGSVGAQCESFGVSQRKITQVNDFTTCTNLFEGYYKTFRARGGISFPVKISFFSSSFTVLEEN